MWDGVTAARGGDPANIYLMATPLEPPHVAGYVSHPEFFKVKDGGLKGAIMASGIYLTGRPLRHLRRLISVMILPHAAPNNRR